MSLFELSAEGLVPFRHVPDGKGVFESRIEDLLWDNLNDITGEVLFPVGRHIPMPSGTSADIVALDADGAVVVIDVTRRLDGGHLARTLEFAGWARNTTLEDLAVHYAAGAEQFQRDWAMFTETDLPLRLRRSARLIIAARNVETDAKSAIDYLQALDVPVAVVQLLMYEDSTGRQYLDIETLAVSGEEEGRIHRGVAIADLMVAGLLGPGERLEWVRPRTQTTHSCYIAEDGRLLLEDCTVAPSPSAAAGKAAGVGAYDGWDVWRAPERGGATLDELRERYLTLSAVDQLPEVSVEVETDTTDQLEVTSGYDLPDPLASDAYQVAGLVDVNDVPGSSDLVDDPTAEYARVSTATPSEGMPIIDAVDYQHG